MTWTFATDNTIDHIISYPIFESELKRESKWASRMNCFYGDIIEAAIKSTKENDCKCFLDITALTTDDGISVSISFRARKRGRTIKSLSRTDLWKHGIIRTRPAIRN